VRYDLPRTIIVENLALPTVPVLDRPTPFSMELPSPIFVVVFQFTTVLYPLIIVLARYVKTLLAKPRLRDTRIFYSRLSLIPNSYPFDDFCYVLIVMPQYVPARLPFNAAVLYGCVRSKAGFPATSTCAKPGHNYVDELVPRPRRWFRALARRFLNVFFSPSGLGFCPPGFCFVTDVFFFIVRI
jgi:hypothetical protein